MKRDMEMVRKVLIEVEATGACDFSAYHGFIFGDDGVSRDEAEEAHSKEYHYKLLVDAGQIRQTVAMQSHGMGDLSWEGHDFLESIRQDSRWNRLKRYVKDRDEDVSSLPIQTIKIIAEKLITEGLM